MHRVGRSLPSIIDPASRNQRSSARCRSAAAPRCRLQRQPGGPLAPLLPRERAAYPAPPSPLQAPMIPGPVERGARVHAGNAKWTDPSAGAPLPLARGPGLGAARAASPVAPVGATGASGPCCGLLPRPEQWRHCPPLGHQCPLAVAGTSGGQESARRATLSPWRATLSPWRATLLARPAVSFGPASDPFTLASDPCPPGRPPGQAVTQRRGLAPCPSITAGARERRLPAAGVIDGGGQTAPSGAARGGRPKGAQGRTAVVASESSRPAAAGSTQAGAGQSGPGVDAFRAARAPGRL